jgi:hypothetical protein
MENLSFEKLVTGLGRDEGIKKRNPIKPFVF